MKFKVGQVWADRIGETWTITDITRDGSDIFPVSALRRDGRSDWFTEDGSYNKDCPDDEDLIELVGGALNFWEARKAALYEGKKVRQLNDLPPLNEVYGKKSFEEYSWGPLELAADWEIVEEVKPEPTKLESWAIVNKNNNFVIKHYDSLERATAVRAQMLGDDYVIVHLTGTLPAREV